MLRAGLGVGAPDRLRVINFLAITINLHLEVKLLRNTIDAMVYPMLWHLLMATLWALRGRLDIIC